MPAAQYRIELQGHLRPEWSEWFEGMTIITDPGGTTTLTGSLRDQAALHGLLIKIRDFGLVLVSVNPVGREQD